MFVNMMEWRNKLIESHNKKPMPILSFPGIQLVDAKVKDIVSDSDLQAKTICAVAERIDSAAAVSLMDLSVEAECFGSPVRFCDDEVPTVTGIIVNDEDDAKKLAVPEVGSGRSGIYIDSVKKAAEVIKDRPVFAGVIGPFSLAGRLMGVSEIMLFCYDDPDTVHTVLEKATRFSIEYCRAYKAAGVNGVIIAEPLAGLMSPSLAQEFSHVYVKRIVEEIQSDDFAVIYHNCGGGVTMMKKDIYAIGAAGYHFGNAVDMSEMLEGSPDDALIMGNVDPAGVFKNGTPDEMRSAVGEILEKCGSAKNFVLSSGCDIPPQTPWENIDEFFAAAQKK